MRIRKYKIKKIKNNSGKKKEHKNIKDNGFDENKKIEIPFIPRFEENTLILNKSLINIFKNFLNLENEVCGYIENIFDKIILKIFSQEEIETTKSLCFHDNFYSPYIFHTHPNNSKSYPSASDIIKVLKYDIIKSSLIFTKWGIWEIYSHVKKKFEKDEQNDIVETINTIFEEFYKLTNKGRTDIPDYIFIKNFMEAFKEVFKKDFKIDIDIILTPWNNEYEINNS